LIALRYNNAMSLVFATCAFAIAWWLGLYLLARDPRSALLLRAGLGLLAYALALAADLLWPALPVSAVLGFVPAILWAGAAIQLLPEQPRRDLLDRFWRLGLLPATVAALLAGVLTGVFDDPPAPALAYLTLGALVVLPLAGCLVLLVRERRTVRPAGVAGVVTVVTLFLGLGTGLLLVPFGWLPRELALLGIGLDLTLLGVAVAVWDAFDAGEALRRDILRSLIASEAAALLFGGLVALAMIAGAGTSPPMVALLLATVAAAIAGQILGSPLQGLADRLAFPKAPQLQEARAALRASEAALPKLGDEPHLADLDPAEFTRLTRRALSHYGDLARLAASPLTHLPQVEARLTARGAPDQPVERAIELQALLGECIARLRPRGQGEFGTTDAWRYYNALYFPYVAGVRPYRRRDELAAHDRIARQALDWFDAQVPERTLHNWQSAGAKLIAKDLQAGLEHHRG
jgi:putative effector of murein hydrolase LrgA (UPF0299 family)